MVAVTTERSFRGVSPEDRRAERHQRLIDGVLDVVAAEGTINVTVDKVCAASRLTKRYFYEAFGDLDSLLLAAADQLFERLFTVMVGAAEIEGPHVARVHDVLLMAEQATRAGVRGVVFGRNVWQHDDPAGIVAALRRVVHGGVPADAALDATGETRQP